MKLRHLLERCSVRAVAGDLDVDVLGLAYDSREVFPGCVFFAIRGTRTDGNRFISNAIAQGAVAVVSASAPVPARQAAWIQIDDERAALAIMAGNFYSHPTEKLHLVGITGTNGKTTTTYLVESILKAAGRPAAVFGTIEYRGPGFEFPAERTTAEAPDLEKLFRQVVDAGWESAVIEVSSHAIAMKRVGALRFEVVVFTNLSRDHLDFHGDMDSYFRTKKRLFEGFGGVAPRVMVLNGDDPRYEELRKINPAAVLSYGMESVADVRPLSYRFTWDGTESTYNTPLGELKLHTSLMGKPNLFNIGAAIGVGISLGLPADAIVRGIEQLASVPGRFESVQAGQPFRVIVDYAHTDDALQKLIRSARDVTTGRVILVFGCGGERDRTKRPVMGEVAARDSDYTIVTSDNPRGEDPMAIIREIEEGMGNAPHRSIVDRREAIRAAFSVAKEGDTVVIAGKGHEPYQTIGTTSYPFDDRLIARELLHEFVTGRN